MPYFSVTRMVAMSSPDSPSCSATSLPIAMASAVARSVESVMGMGQNSPLAVFMPSHTPCQSAWVMKPSSGVKPPMPSMIRSPSSRELMTTLGSVAARACSARKTSPASSSGFSSPPPWGLTNLDMAFLENLDFGGFSVQRARPWLGPF